MAKVAGKKGQGEIKMRLMLTWRRIVKVGFKIWTGDDSRHHSLIISEQEDAKRYKDTGEVYQAAAGQAVHLALASIHHDGELVFEFGDVSGPRVWDRNILDSAASFPYATGLIVVVVDLQSIRRPLSAARP